VSLVPRGQVVVHAQLVDHCGFALQRTVQVSEHRDRNGFQQVERRTHAFQLAPGNFKPRQPLSTLNLDHDKSAILGDLVALQRTGDGLWGTWVCDAPQLLSLRGDTYVSAETRWDGATVTPPTSSCAAPRSSHGPRRAAPGRR